MRKTIFLQIFLIATLLGCTSTKKPTAKPIEKIQYIILYPDPVQPRDSVAHLKISNSVKYINISKLVVKPGIWPEGLPSNLSPLHSLYPKPRYVNELLGSFISSSQIAVIEPGTYTIEALPSGRYYSGPDNTRFYPTMQQGDFDAHPGSTYEISIEPIYGATTSEYVDGELVEARVVKDFEVNIRQRYPE